MTSSQDSIELRQRVTPPAPDKPQDEGGREAAAPPAPERTLPASPRRWLRPALFSLLPLALVAGAYWYVTGGQVISMDDAYIEADQVGISTDVSGIVKEVDVADNQHVQPGQVLYRLDDLPFRLALQRTEAQIGTVRNDLHGLGADYQDVQAQITQAQDDVAYYTSELSRQQDLLTAHVASQSAFGAARRNLQNAQQKQASLSDHLASVAARSEPAIRRIPGRASSRAMPTRWRSCDERRGNCAPHRGRKPFAGIATNVPSIARGKYLQASTTAFNLVAADHVWVDADPKETELTYVRAGQRATVRVDTYPGVQWRGVVESISPAAAAQFSLLPAQNSSGNWVKVVQRIPVRVRVDTSDARSLPPLRAGMRRRGGAVDTES